MFPEDYTLVTYNRFRSCGRGTKLWIGIAGRRLSDVVLSTQLEEVQRLAMDAMSSAGTKPDSFALAMDRTWLAHERTLMAWVRTAASMISFGFTIYKFFQFEEGRGSPATHRLLTPRDFALIMVSIGLVSLLLATLAHRRDVRNLEGGCAQKRYSLAELVAGIVSIFGLLVLVATIFRG